MDATDAQPTFNRRADDQYGNIHRVKNRLTLKMQDSNYTANPNLSRRKILCRHQCDNTTIKWEIGLITTPLVPNSH